MKQWSLRGDWTLLIPVFSLIAIGVLMIFSTSPVVGYANYGDSFFFIKKHLVYVGIGIFALLMGYSVRTELYQKYVLVGFSWAVFLLLLTLIPGVGVTIGGASRWLSLKFINLQPVEFAKFMMVVFVATSLENKHMILNQFSKGILPILMALAVPLTLLLKQPDLGNVGLTLLVVVAMLFVSPIPVRHLVSLGVGAIVLLAANILTHPYQMARITSFLNPEVDPMGKNYHMIQSLIAIGSGGFFGGGLGESKLKYFYLPLQYSDFIFSIVCEEGGFILAVLVLILFAWFFLKSLRIAHQAKTRYNTYLVLGLTFYIVFQALFNIGVVIGVLPVTGIPLTFISFGGTSLVISLYFVGVIVHVSKRNQEEAHELYTT